MCFFVTVKNPISVDEDFAFGKISLGGAICIATKFLLMRHLQAKKESEELYEVQINCNLECGCLDLS